MRLSCLDRAYEGLLVTFNHYYHTLNHSKYKGQQLIAPAIFIMSTQLILFLFVRFINISQKIIALADQEKDTNIRKRKEVIFS